MNKKIGVISLAAATLLLVGCGSSEKGKSGDAKGAPEKTEIVLWEQMEPGVREKYLELVKKFEQENPDVAVKVVHYAVEDLRTQFQNSSLAGQGPDLVYGPNDNVGVFSVSGLIKDVREVVPGDMVAKFDKNVFESGRIGDNYYLLPEFNGNQIALLYNKALVQEVPGNWEEFAKIAQGLQKVDSKNKANSVYGFLYNEKEPFWFIGFYQGYGGKIFDKDYNPTLDNEAMVKALQFVKDVRGKYGLGEAGMDYALADELFKQGKAAFILNGAWSWAEYKNSGIDIGIAPMVTLPEGGTPLFTSASKGYSVSANSDEKKYPAVNKFLNYIFTPENNAMISVAQSQAPAITAARELETVKNDELMQASIATVDKTLPMEIVPEMRAVWDAMRPNLEAVVNGQLTPEEAAKKMQESALQGIKTIKGN